MLKPQHKSLAADIGLFYAAAIWGTTFVLVKRAIAEIDPVILVGYRFTLAGLLVTAVLLIKRKPVLMEWRKGLFLGFIIWLLYVPQTLGLKFTTASNSAFITGLFVAFVPLFLLTLFKRKPTRWELAATGVALLGLWVLTGGMAKINTGDAMTLITAMAYALHLLYADKYMKQGVDPYIISAQQFLFAGIFAVLTGVLSGASFSARSSATISIIIFLTVFPTLSAFVIQLMAQRIAAPLKVSLIFALEPVFAATFAWTVGGERLILSGAVGGALIFAALVLSGISTSRQIR